MSPTREAYTAASVRPANMSESALEALASALPLVIQAGPNAAGAAVRLLAEVNSERRERSVQPMEVDHA